MLCFRDIAVVPGQPLSWHGNPSGKKLFTGVNTHYSGEAQGLVMHWDAAWLFVRASNAPRAHHSKQVTAVVALALSGW